MTLPGPVVLDLQSHRFRPQVQSASGFGFGDFGCTWTFAGLCILESRTRAASKPSVRREAGYLIAMRHVFTVL